MSILRFSGRTNNGHCIQADSLTSGYDKHFGIHVYKKVSEYDQDIPQSQTADQPT